MAYNVGLIHEFYWWPESKASASNQMSGLMLLVNDPPSMLVPKEKPRDTNSISYYVIY